jgi:hypothetical protein
MAITRDNFALIRTTNTATSTISFANAGNVLVAFVTNSFATPGITSVTYNGDAMTYTGSSVTWDTNLRLSRSYVLVNPDIGTFNLVATYPNDVGNVCSLTGVSYSGASATQPDAVDSTAEFTTSSYSDSITIVDDDSWLVGVGWNRAAKFTTGSGVFTFLGDDSDAFAATLCDSNGGLAAGSQTYGMSGGGSGQANAALAVSIAPAGAAAATLVGRRMLMGIGS